MIQVIECTGDPRQQGASQGEQCRGAIQARLRAAGLPVGKLPLPNLRPLASGPVLGRGIGREVVRHYTHLAERTAGIARSAQAPVASLMQLFLRETARGAASAGLTAAAPLAVAGASHGSIFRGLRQDAGVESPWIVRRSRPAVGFGSVEVTLPWLATAVAGVNEAGVSVAFLPLEHWPTSLAGVSPAPSPVLLVQECLQRFDGLEGCLDWCGKRPVEGAASLIIADASGQIAKLVVTGREREVRRYEAGDIVETESRAILSDLSSGLEQAGKVPVERIVGPRSESGLRLAVELIAEKRCVQLHCLGENGIETSLHSITA